MKKMSLELQSLTMDDGVAIGYVDVGAGRPLVYVNGFGEDVSRSNLLIERWSESFRCITFDHRGYGSSELAPDLGVERSARDLKALLEKLDLSDVALVGYSMGGSVAFSYIEQFGLEHLGRLVLADTAPKLINEDDWNLGLWQGKYTREDFNRDLETLMNDPTLFHLAFYSRAATKTSCNEYSNVFPDHGDIGGWFDYLSELTSIRRPYLEKIFQFNFSEEKKECERRYWDTSTGGDWRHVLKSIGVPTLCLYADPGSFYNSATAEVMVSQIPNASAVAIKDACHTFPKDNLEAFSSLITEFCSQDN